MPAPAGQRRCAAASLVRKSTTIAEHHGSDQGRNSRGDMYDDATSKIHNTKLTEPAAAQTQWQRAVTKISQAKSMTAEKRIRSAPTTDDERRCDNHKGQLEKREGALGNGTRSSTFANLRQPNIV